MFKLNAHNIPKERYINKTFTQNSTGAIGV